MRILMINSVCGIRSTGRICTDLATALEEQGHDVKIAYGRGTVPKQFEQYAVRIGNDFSVISHVIKARFLDGAGFGSKNATAKFIEWVKEYNPDVIHLHNIHGYYINVEKLFNYLRMCGKKIIWTLHDCWSFTGHCAYFEYIECDKWKVGCECCTQRKEYPARWLLDSSKTNYKKKRELFTSVGNITLVVPSLWLASLVKASYMKKHPVRVIHNGVDTLKFKSTHGNIREEYGIGNKKVILGIAAVWDKRKGLETFEALSKRLSEDYQIILVGLSRRQIKRLPSNVIGISQIEGVERLAELYTLAEVFVNPTLEDNYPTTNIEAIACGTPVVTYDTGGSAESARMYGTVVLKNDIDGLVEAIKNIKEIKKRNINIDYRDSVKQYVSLYNEL